MRTKNNTQIKNLYLGGTGEHYRRAHFVNNSKRLGGGYIPPSPIRKIKTIIHKAWSLTGGRRGYIHYFWGYHIREQKIIRK